VDGEIQAELRQINTRLGRMEAQLDTHVAAHMALAGGTNERVVGLEVRTLDLKRSVDKMRTMSGILGTIAGVVAGTIAVLLGKQQ